MGSGERMASSDRIGTSRQASGELGDGLSSRGLTGKALSASGEVPMVNDRRMADRVDGHAAMSTRGVTAQGALTGDGALPGSSAARRSGAVDGATASSRSRTSAVLGAVRVFTDRPAFERRLRSELERHGFAVDATAPDRLPDAIEPRSVVVIDGAAEAYDADELLAHVGLVRALGAQPAVALRGADASGGADDAGIADIEDLVDDLCGGLVMRGDADVPKVAAIIARRAAALAAARFEYLTVSPRQPRGARTADGEATTPAPLLAIFADTACTLVERPVAVEDDGSEVVAITIADDAGSARIELSSGRTLALSASEAWARSARAPAGEGRTLSAAEILAQIDGPTLGGRIRTLRLGAGLTQAELARRTGIHRPNIARVEAGRHTPSLETIARLAAAIGVSATRVLEG